MLRLLVNDPLADGQLLNFAAAVVFPGLTRPAGTHTGSEIAGLLAEKSLDHSDLAPALLEAFERSDGLISICDPNDGLDMRYIPRPG